LLGKNVLPLISPEDLPRLQKIFIETLSGNPQSYEVEVFNKNKETLILAVNNVPLFHGDSITGTVSFGRDITNQKIAEKKIQEQSKFLQSILEALTYPFYVIDAKDYTIKLANKAAMNDRLGKGSTCYAITHKFNRPCNSEDHPCPLEIVKQTKKPTQVEHLHHSDDGRLQNSEVHGYPIFDDNGDLIQIIEYSMDISDRKKAEEAIIEAKEKAEEMNRLKSNFLANMSHELRTPMIGILGFAEILKGESDISEMKKIADSIYSSGNRLMETLNQILDLSLIEADKHKINTSEVKIADIVLESVKLNKPFADSNNLFLQTSINDKTAAAKLDERLLLQIINNLVNNAIKFTEEGGVTVEVGKDRIDGKSCVVIKVKDTGIGISKEHHNFIFEEFRQVSEGLGRTYEGSGLGLSITKKFVDLLGGKILLDSQIGKGSTFIVLFPSIKTIKSKKKITENDIPASEDGTVSYPGSKILLVDDDQNTIDLVKLNLKNICSVQDAPNGETAI